ncbi:MAG: RNA pseudouridine synthase [Pseudomonadota bacterium]|nr:RNA pseudouridine synthase [Desulfobacterales bacterium]MBL7102606.1 RNA pseudouridine synthase [Desulfobacteraceae bacterium]
MENYFYIHEWPVFYEDNHLMVLYKPAGLLMQGDRTGDISLLDLGKQWIKARYEKPGRVFLGLVHRLDRPVAGVVLFCRTSKSARRISEQFRTHRPEKRYVAVVEGIPPNTSGDLIQYLERHGPTSRVVSRPTNQSQEARLHYQVLDTHKAHSLMEIHLETGRHHQIRVQLAHLGVPILGDMRYGASGPLPQRQIALFSDQLTVTHPTLHTELPFQCPFPRGWPWPIAAPLENRPAWNWEDLVREVMPLIRLAQN